MFKIPDMFKICGTVYVFLATDALDFDLDVIYMQNNSREGDITFSGGQYNISCGKKTV